MRRTIRTPDDVPAAPWQPWAKRRPEQALLPPSLKTLASAPVDIAAVRDCRSRSPVSRASGARAPYDTGRAAHSRACAPGDGQSRHTNQRRDRHGMAAKASADRMSATLSLSVAVHPRSARAIRLSRGPHQGADDFRATSCAETRVRAEPGALSRSGVERRRPEQRPRPQRSAEALRGSGHTSSTSMPTNSPTTLHAIAHACVPASPWPSSLRATSQARADSAVLVDSRCVLVRVAALGPPDGAGDDLAGRRHPHPHDDARPVIPRERGGVGRLGIADVPASECEVDSACALGSVLPRRSVICVGAVARVAQVKRPRFGTWWRRWGWRRGPHTPATMKEHDRKPNSGTRGGHRDRHPADRA